MLIQQAKRFGDKIEISELKFKYSKGWLDKFKRRHCRKYAGEVGSVDKAAVQLCIDSLPEITCKFKLCDIYNFG